MKNNYKILPIIFVLIISLLIFTGCSNNTPTSDGNTSNTDAQVNLVDPPERLLSSNETQSIISNNISTSETNKVDDVLINRMHIYMISEVTKDLNKYLEPKLEGILNIEEDTFNVTTKEFYMDENGDSQKIENEFDITISKDLNSPYNEKYDLKYTLKYSETSNIKTILYVSYDRKRFNLLEKYEIRANSYAQSGHYYQVIHNEEAKTTHMKFHEISNTNRLDESLENATYTSDIFIRLNELEDTKEFEFVRIGNSDIIKRVSSFASIENRSNGNITAEFYYKGSDSVEDSYFHDELNKIESKISVEDSSTSSAPMKFGYILGTTDFEFEYDDIDNFTAKDGYPSGKEVLERHQQMIDFKTLFQVEFDTQKMQYEGMTFLDSMGITEEYN